MENKVWARIGSGLARKLETFAAANDVSYSQIVRAALIEYLRKWGDRDAENRDCEPDLSDDLQELVDWVHSIENGCKKSARASEGM